MRIAEHVACDLCEVDSSESEIVEVKTVGGFLYLCGDCNGNRAECVKRDIEAAVAFDEGEAAEGI